MRKKKESERELSKVRVLSRERDRQKILEVAAVTCNLGREIDKQFRMSVV